MTSQGVPLVLEQKAQRRVAILLPTLGIGGAERVSLTLAEEFISNGFGVDMVVMSATGPLLQHIPPACRLFDFKQARLRNAAIPLYRYFRKERPDAIVANIWPLTLAAALASKFAGLSDRVVCVHQNAIGPQYFQTGRHSSASLRLCIKTELSLSRAVVGCSQGVVTDLAAVSGLPEDRFTLLPNPVKIAAELPHAVMAEAEKHWSVPRGGRILAVGNLKRQKNYPLLLETFALLAGDPKLQLIVIGEGDLRLPLEAQRSQLGLDGRVSMPGQSTTIEAFYRTADVFVMSSDFEGLPTVLIEAMGSGLSIVSTDCPHGPREILGGGEYGRLVPTNDANALAAAIADVLRHPFDTAILKERATEFSPARAAERYLKLFFG